MKLLYLFILILSTVSCSEQPKELDKQTDNSAKESNEELKFEFGTNLIKYDQFCTEYLDKMFHTVGFIPDEISIFEIVEFEPTVEIVTPTVALDSGVFMHFQIVNHKTRDTSQLGAFKFHKSDCFVPMECYSNAIVFTSPITTVYLPFENIDLTCGSQNYSDEYSDSSFTGVWTQTDKPNK
jgi:hypothetical protein